VSESGNGGGDRRWTALYAKADVELLVFDRTWERVAVSRNEVGAREDARVVRVRDARRMRLAAMVLSGTALQHQGK